MGVCEGEKRNAHDPPTRVKMQTPRRSRASRVVGELVPTPQATEELRQSRFALGTPLRKSWQNRKEDSWRQAAAGDCGHLREADPLGSSRGLGRCAPGRRQVPGVRPAAGVSGRRPRDSKRDVRPWVGSNHQPFG